MNKIIHVLMHSTYNRDIVDWNLRNGWHVRLGRAINEYTDYQAECWGIDFDTDGERRFESDGLCYRVFPSTLLPGTQTALAKRFIGEAKHGEEFSWRLFRALRSELRRGTAVHFHGDIYLNTYVASLLPGTKVLHHHGGLQGVPTVEQYAFSTLDHLFVLTRHKRSYYIDTVGMSPSSVTIQPMGVDFDAYRPSGTRKEQLGFDADHLLMYTGAFDAYKGLDVVLDIFKKLREDFDLELVIFGGDEKDDLFPRVAQTDGVTPVTTHVSDDEYIRHLDASDAYVSFPIEKSLMSGDCGLIAPAEAMACDTPLVSPVVLAYPESLRDALPFAPRTPAEFERDVRDALNGTVSDFPWRKTSKRQFSWATVAETVARSYSASA